MTERDQNQQLSNCAGKAYNNLLLCDKNIYYILKLFTCDNAETLSLLQLNNHGNVILFCVNFT